MPTHLLHPSSWSTISYLWSDQRRYLVALLARCSARRLWLGSPTVPTARASLAAGGTGLPLFDSLAWYGADAKGKRRHMQFYYENLYVSSFYDLGGDAGDVVARGPLEAAPRAAAANAAFSIPASCDATAKPPHIILIHEELVLQPSLFPTLRYDHSVDPFYSYDDRLHRLRAGDLWRRLVVDGVPLLAGVSTDAFGGMRQFVQIFTENKLKDMLPQALERCGYRNVVFYPMMRNFVSNDRFYTPIGLKEIFDMRSQRAKTAQERDRFYYGNAMAEMERHFKSSRKPLFMLIQTTSAHWP